MELDTQEADTIPSSTPATVAPPFNIPDSPTADTMCSSPDADTVHSSPAMETVHTSPSSPSCTRPCHHHLQPLPREQSIPLQQPISQSRLTLQSH